MMDACVFGGELKKLNVFFPILIYLLQTAKAHSLWKDLREYTCYDTDLLVFKYYWDSLQKHCHFHSHWIKFMMSVGLFQCRQGSH